MTATVGETTCDKTPAEISAARPLNVAIIGNPNVGKSTIFNALSGIRVRTGNYPGVTVDRKVGRYTCDGREINLIDLPGTYSLAAKSIDEQIAVDVLRNGDPIAGQMRRAWLPDRRGLARIPGNGRHGRHHAASRDG